MGCSWSNSPKAAAPPPLPPSPARHRQRADDDDEEADGINPLRVQHQSDHGPRRQRQMPDAFEEIGADGHRVTATAAPTDTPLFTIMAPAPDGVTPRSRRDESNLDDGASSAVAAQSPHPTATASPEGLAQLAAEGAYSSTRQRLSLAGGEFVPYRRRRRPSPNAAPHTPRAAGSFSSVASSCRLSARALASLAEVGSVEATSQRGALSRTGSDVPPDHGGGQQQQPQSGHPVFQWMESFALPPASGADEADPDEDQVS